MRPYVETHEGIAGNFGGSYGGMLRPKNLGMLVLWDWFWCYVGSHVTIKYMDTHLCIRIYMHSSSPDQDSTKLKSANQNRSKVCWKPPPPISNQAMGLTHNMSLSNDMTLSHDIHTYLRSVTYEAYILFSPSIDTIPSYSIYAPS